MIIINQSKVKQQQLAKLDAEYQPQFAELSQAMVMATLVDNTALITEIKAEYLELKTEYEAKRRVIESGS